MPACALPFPSIDSVRRAGVITYMAHLEERRTCAHDKAHYTGIAWIMSYLDEGQK